MTSHRWRTVKRIFHDAIDIPGPERSTFIKRACDGDDGLRFEIESLIVSHEEAGKFLSPPRCESQPLWLGDAEVRLIGSRIGAYEILREIGRGGMGACRRTGGAWRRYPPRAGL